MEEIWYADDACWVCQKALLQYFEVKKETMGAEYFNVNQYECRYEETEMKWLANYQLNNMIFIKKELCFDHPKAISCILQTFWETLDLFGPADASMEHAMSSRFEKLKQGMSTLYNMKALSKEQIVKCIEFMKKTLFSHLHLFLACLARKQTKVEKRLHIFPEHPTMDMNDLDNECTEMVEDTAVTGGNSLANDIG